MSTSNFTIGKLAKSADVNVETIRFYERKGLIQQPEKQGKFRYYSQEHTLQIRFIRRSQELGFTLAETKELLELSIADQVRCGHILEKAENKIIEIEKKIADLSDIKTSLEQLKTCCDDPNIAINECSILETFKERK